MDKYGVRIKELEKKNNILLTAKENIWKVLIVNIDQKNVEKVKNSLESYTYQGKRVKVIEAKSHKEAKYILIKNRDILISVIGLQNDIEAGKDLISFIRGSLENDLMRILTFISDEVNLTFDEIKDMNINGIKNINNISSDEIILTIAAEINNFYDKYLLSYSKMGLEKIIESSGKVFEFGEIKEFTSMMLVQLFSILDFNNRGVIDSNSAIVASSLDEDYVILAAAGKLKDTVGLSIKKALDEEQFSIVYKGISSESSQYENDTLVLYFKNDFGVKTILYVENLKGLTDLDIYLGNTFCRNVSVAYDNIYLNNEIDRTQKEIIYTLGEISETRSNETGHHVKRVAEYSKLLTLKYGLTKRDAEIIELASPMHDLGKLAIPDIILNKPGKLTFEEFKVMKTHAEIGYEMLKNSNDILMKTAAIIALEHHEKYDGTGYPYGKKGEEIHIAGRITAIADVFDALGSERVYKKAWPLEDILELFRKERGKHFDPVLVDLFLDNLDEFLEIRDKYKEIYPEDIQR